MTSVANDLSFQEQIEKLVFPVQTVVYFRSGRHEIERRKQKRKKRWGDILFAILHLWKRKELLLLLLFIFSFLFLIFLFLPISALAKLQLRFFFSPVLFLLYVDVERKKKVSQVEAKKEDALDCTCIVGTWKETREAQKDAQRPTSNYSAVQQQIEYRGS